MADTYTANGDLVVYNNFSNENSMTWAHAFSACSIESTFVFRPDKKLIFYNNRFGTLSKASNSDLVDIYSLFRYLQSSHYKNASQCLEIAMLPFISFAASQFEMYHREGWVADCRTMPVMDNYKLAGVVLLAHRKLGSALQNGQRRNQCEQFSPRNYI